MAEAYDGSDLYDVRPHFVERMLSETAMAEPRYCLFFVAQVVVDAVNLPTKFVLMVDYHGLNEQKCWILEAVLYCSVPPAEYHCCSCVHMTEEEAGCRVCFVGEP